MNTSLQQQLQSDLLTSMRGKDSSRLSTLRLVKASIQNAEIAKGEPLDHDEVLGILAREAKQRKESIAEFHKGDRTDLVKQEEIELEIILEYMPEQMSRDDVIASAREVILSVGAEGPSDIGKVMGRLMPLLRGKADGKQASEVVAELLRSLH